MKSSLIKPASALRNSIAIPNKSPPPPKRVSLPVSLMNVTALEAARNTLELAVTMQSELGDKICDRRWRKFKVYKKCFLHADAIGWMKQYLTKESDEADETEAVKKLNEMLDAGYVSHVCNEHRFKVSEKEVLFFHFHNDVMEADKRSLQKGHTNGRGWDEQHQDDASLKLSLERLTSSVKKYSEQLDEAHGRILVLEEAVASLGFACGVAVFVTLWNALYRILPTVLQGRMAMMVYTAIAGVALMWHPNCDGSMCLLNVALHHLSVLLKLMNPSIGYGDSFRDDIDSVEESMRRSSKGLSQQSRRGSVLREMSKLVSFRQKPSSRRMVSEGSYVGIKMREAWDLPDETSWPHRPALLCVNTPVSSLLQVSQHGTGPCPIGVPFEFSSELFEGKCLVRLKDVSSDDPASDDEYFLGRRRRFQAIVQGRFKQELKVSEVLTGHEFVRPLRRLPPSWMVRAGTNFIRRLAPGAQIVLDGDNPRALAILAATSQAVSADMPGNEPDISNNSIPEDASLLGGEFSEGNTPAATRKKILANPDRAEKYTFDTESVYTFDFYQNLLDVATYSLDLGFTKLGLCKCLDGQPIQVMGKTVDGRYLWSFQLWHEQLLEGDAKKQ